MQPCPLPYGAHLSLRAASAHIMACLSTSEQALRHSDHVLLFGTGQCNSNQCNVCSRATGMPAADMTRSSYYFAGGGVGSLPVTVVVVVG